MYIGQRKFGNGWKNYYGSGRHYKRAENKYGKENFSRKIIDIGSSQEELNELEIYYINLYDAVNSSEYYNIADGGKSGNTFAGKSEEEMKEICKKISESRIGEKNPNYGKSFFGANNPFYRKRHNEKSKENISKSLSGKNNPNYGKPMSEETKTKQRIAHSGKKHSEETKKKMSESKFGKNNPKSRTIILLNTMEIFDTAIDAYIKYRVNNCDICKCCMGKLKSAGKHHETKEKLVWMYYEEWLEQHK